MKLSVIIPAYNERSTIEEVIRRVLAVPLKMEREIIVVDDGSYDGTAEILKALEDEKIIKVHTSLVNQGKGAALRVALEHVTGEIVLIQDADLELDPNEYPRLLEPILCGHSAVVYGSRFLQRLPNITLKTRMLNWVYVSLTNLLCGSRLSDVGTAYKVFRTSVLTSLDLQAVGFDIDADITVNVLRHNYAIAEVPISYHPRDVIAGKKIRWWHGIGIICRLAQCRLRGPLRMRPSRQCG